MDKRTKNKILNGSNNIFAGYSERYSRIILEGIIENPRITKEELAFYKFRYQGKNSRKIPIINNEYIAQKYIDWVKQCTKEA